LSGFAEYYPGGTLPADLQAEIDRHGGTIAAYVDYLYDHSPSVSQAAAEAADTTALREDAALRLLGCFAFGTPGHPAPLVRNLSNVPSVERWYRPYMKALMEFDPGRAFFPDANLTLRVAYGAVEGYRYVDGLYHKPLTTIEGHRQGRSGDLRLQRSAWLREPCAAQITGRWAAEMAARPCRSASLRPTTPRGNSDRPR
ncbi:MAG: S46 family peptidase, partial [Alistipes sp.]